jgi:hypothetical protein
MDMFFLPTLNMQAQKASDSLRHHKNRTGAALSYRLRISLASGGHGLSAETQPIVAPLHGRYKMELYEQIRREYEFGVGSVIGVARKLGVRRCEAPFPRSARRRNVRR